MLAAFGASRADMPETFRLAEVVPYVSMIVLECTTGDPAVAFGTLRQLLRRTALDAGRTGSSEIRWEVTVAEHEVIDEVGALEAHGIDELYVLIRRLIRPPGWARTDIGITDVANQITIALRRNKLVAVHTDITTDAQFGRWIRREAAPYRFIPSDVLAGTFRGDGKMIWTRGVHRRRRTKADSKALGGLRVQEVLDPLEDATYALSAAQINYQPTDDKSVLRNGLTFSAGKSRLAWQRASNFAQFLTANLEALDALEKALVAEEVPDALFPQLAVREADLGRVRGAYDISVIDPVEVGSEPDADEDRVERAELLRGAIVEVRGEPNSADAVVDIGYDGCIAGTLKIKPIEAAGGFTLDIRLAGPPTDEEATRAIKEAMQDGDLLTIYYESGHAYGNNQITKQNLVSVPYPNLRFADFTGFTVTQEKPKQKPGQSLHDAIGENEDRSLFGWAIQQYADGWLLCDDGAGEIADFLHLRDDGTLTAIHIKAAGNNTLDRRIAVTRFEQVVSQAEKNIHLLDNDMLIERLGSRDLAKSAAWHDGRRIAATDFVLQLHTRVRTDKTNVVIVQPHLLRHVYDRARAATESNNPNRDSYSLILLDNLLHSTRRTVITRCDDLTVIGCR